MRVETGESAVKTEPPVTPFMPIFMKLSGSPSTSGASDDTPDQKFVQPLQTFSRDRWISSPWCLRHSSSSSRASSSLCGRSEEHTSELQSRGHLVCRLLLEKKNKNHNDTAPDVLHTAY